MAIETDTPTLLKLCWMINEGWEAELAYTRAQYRVSYYRKLKAKLEASKKPSEKWSDLTELTKQIERCRLTALKKQDQMIKTRKKYGSLIALALNKVKGRIETTYGGKVICFYLHIKGEPAFWRKVEPEEIVEKAHQHDADTALTRVLTK